MTVTAYSNGENMCTRTVTKGLPQGAVSSPELFNQYLRKIESCLPEDAKFYQFADDMAITFAHKDLRVVSETLNSAMEKINEFLKQKCLTISKTKTVLMLFSNFDQSLRYEGVNRKVRIENTPINLVNSYRYLGIYLKYNLNFSLHIDSIYKASRKLLAILKMTAGISWGAHPKILLNIYRGLIRSRLEWGSQFISQGNKKDRKKTR